MNEADIRRRNIAIKRLHQLEDSDLEDARLIEWMERAPVGIVEFNGKLEGETDLNRNHRMELFRTYDGEYKDVTKYLKEMDPEKYATTTIWQSIFIAYNEIQNVDEILSKIKKANNYKEIMQDSDNSLFNKEVTTVKEVEEKKQVKPKETKRVEEPNVVDIPKTLVKENFDYMNKDLYHVNKEEPKVLEGKAPESRTLKAEPKVELSTTSETQTKETVNNKTNSNDEKEKTNMANQTSQLDLLAGKGKNAQNLNAKGANSKPTASSEMTAKVKEAVTATLSARTAWTKNNVVTRVIIPAEPTSLRFPQDPHGVVATVEGAPRRTAIAKIYKNFKAATGYEPDAVIEGEEQSILDKFPKVKDEDERKKALATLTLIEEIRNNNDLELPIYLPATPSYPVKGVFVGDAAYSMSEFQNLLITESAGAAYGVGSLDSNGKPIQDATVFVLSTVQKTKKVTTAAKGSAPNLGANTPVKEKITDGVVRIANKKAFLDASERIAIVYNTVADPDETQLKYVGAKATIVVDGVVLPASFRYESDEKVVDAAGKEIENKTKTFSVMLRSRAVITESTPNAEFGTVEEAAKFGKGVGAGETKTTTDYTDSEAVSALLAGKVSESTGTRTENPLIKLMASMASGTAVKIAGEAELEIITKIKNDAVVAEKKTTKAAKTEMMEDTI